METMYKVFVGLIALVLTLTGPAVYAVNDSALLLSDDQISQVRANCVSSQATLTRIHENDGLMRVNLGQQYEGISTRLMTPLNGRIALNKLDGIELAKTTVAYNKEIDTFRNLYQDYEQTVTTALQMNCRNQPVGFYDSVMLARDKRQMVHESVIKLQEYVKQYRAQFTDFSKKILEKGKAS